MNRIIRVILATICLAAGQAGQAASPVEKQAGTVQAQKVQAERLPDLNIPRTFHLTYCFDGELTVIGGHTSGFVPTATAEYLKDGEWHTVKTVYTHDGGLSVPLKSGKVLVGGGFEKDLGIGQIHSVERYDPKTHTFEGFGCLDTRRAYASAIESDSGHVIISGNWYHDDSMEEFDGKKLFTLADSVLLQRCSPYLFRTSRDNVMVLGNYTTRGTPYNYPTTVDRLKGGPVAIELLRTWQPIWMLLEHRPEQSFIGDEEKDIYAYLVALMNREGKLAIALVRNGEMKLVPTKSELPTMVASKKVEYLTTVIADRQRGRGYVIGKDEDNRRYILIIEYARAIDKDYRLNGKPAPIIIGYTDPLDDLGVVTTAALTEEGDLFMAGGSLNADNFIPTSGAWLLRLGSGEKNAALPWWAIVVAGAIAALIGLMAYRAYKSYKTHKAHNPNEPEPQKPNEPKGDEALMARICDLMEQQQLYMKSDIKISDLATELGTNVTYVTNCIRQCRGCTFPQFVANYRVEYAKQLLRQNPNKKMSNVCDEAGFPTETTFFRTFKKVTGMSPSEWAAQYRNG
ncbi:MAG: helix-turn-helix domain-containing protein [Prevotella sp.]|nr:helix-turn-helix domain-containing protein [Prevotella sp.]